MRNNLKLILQKQIKKIMADKILTQSLWAKNPVSTIDINHGDREVQTAISRKPAQPTSL